MLVNIILRNFISFFLIHDALFLLALIILGRGWEIILFFNLRDLLNWRRIIEGLLISLYNLIYNCFIIGYERGWLGCFCWYLLDLLLNILLLLYWWLYLISLIIILCWFKNIGRLLFKNLWWVSLGDVINRFWLNKVILFNILRCILNIIIIVVSKLLIRLRLLI